MPLRFPQFLSLVLALAWNASALADTFTLKSGEKFEGKVIKETPTDYTVDYKASAGITDTRTVLKTDVASVEKEMPDEAPYQAIKNIKPGSSSLPLAQYDPSIQALQYFVNQFPNSAHNAEVAPALAELAQEKGRVEGGEVKIDGKWISKEDVQKERYQINGRAIYAHMQEQARRGDLVGGLNSFAQLEKDYPGSAVFPDAVALARQLATKLKPAAEQALETWKVQKKERAAAMQLMSEPQKSQTIAAQKREEQQADAAYEATTKGGAKWLPMQRHEKTLAALASNAEKEVKRLDLLPVAKMRDSLQAVNRARTEQAGGNLDNAITEARQASSLWAQNEYAVRLNKELSALKVAASKATPVPATTPTPLARATPNHNATPVVLATPPPEEPKGFFSTPAGLGVMSVVLIGGIVGYFIYKRKKAAAEQPFEPL